MHMCWRWVRMGIDPYGVVGMSRALTSRSIDRVTSADQRHSSDRDACRDAAP